MTRAWKVPVRNVVLRMALAAFLLSILFFYQDLFDHTRAHFTGSIKDTMVTGQWHIVVLNIVLFCSFLIPLSFRRKANWKEYGIVVAFFVSLFVEMYGIPATVMFTSKYLLPSPTVELDAALTFKLFGIEFFVTMPMFYGLLLMVLGTVFVIIGWYTLYKAVKKDELVTSGIYSISRNPQYLGFILVIAGWLIGWPTVITVIFSTVLIILYIRLCYVEEGEISDLAGFKEYRKKVPLMI
jgi:protein-S-isoprenylcysteine O-methyltransferase Ste14